MELKEAIETRRSIRHYQKAEVPLPLIAEILETARLAPSAGNTQNWRFIIVGDNGKKKEISDICRGQHWMTEAPVHIVVCNSYKKLVSLYNETGKKFSIQGCAIIASYIQLLAIEKGLGTCWVGAFDAEKLHHLLQLPEETSVEAVITLGCPDDAKHSQIRNECTDLCYFEKWGEKEAKKENFSLKEKVKSSREMLKGLFRKEE